MPFKKGQSGNPAGRPKGAREKRLKWMLSHERALQERVVQDALNGNQRAMQIVADRLWPKIRPEALPVSVGKVNGDFEAQAKRIVDASLTGEMAPDTARDLLAGLADLVRIRDFSEFEKRLTAAEQGGAPLPWEINDQPEKPTRELLPLRAKHRRKSTCDET